MNTLAKLAAGIEAFIDWTGRLTSWLTLTLVLMIAGEVVLRYLFSQGAVWAQELEWHLLAVIALWGVSYTQKEDAHVRVDVFYSRFSERTKLWMELLSAVFVMVPFALYIAWLSVHFVGQSYDMAEISPDPGGLTNRWVLKSFVTTGFLLLAIHGIAIALKSAAALFGKGGSDAAQ